VFKRVLISASVTSWIFETIQSGVYADARPIRETIVKLFSPRRRDEFPKIARSFPVTRFLPARQSDERAHSRAVLNNSLLTYATIMSLTHRWRGRTHSAFPLATHEYFYGSSGSRSMNFSSPVDLFILFSPRV